MCILVVGIVVGIYFLGLSPALIRDYRNLQHKMKIKINKNQKNEK